MSGRLSNRPQITRQGALNRLVLMSLVAWALLIAASLAEHSRDGQWGPIQVSAIAGRA